jgi:RNA polymerase sigma-70 factor (ECF subfamily)
MLSSTRDGAAAASPSLEAFSEKYSKYFPRVFAYIYARVGNIHLTEDLVSEVFERAFTKSESLRSEAAFSTWLFTIARNAIISQGRKRSRETLVDPEVMQEIAPHSASVESQVLQQEEMQDVARLVRQFPQREQDIISLKFDAELPNHQIAEIMGLTEPNVRVIIFRTLRKLREMLAAEAAR